MLRAVLRHQGEEKISVTKAGPGHIAAELMAFDRIVRQFAFDLVVDQRDEALERRVVFDARCDPLLSVIKISGIGAAPSAAFDRNFELNRIMSPRRKVNDLVITVPFGALPLKANVPLASPVNFRSPP